MADSLRSIGSPIADRKCDVETQTFVQLCSQGEVIVITFARGAARTWILEQGPAIGSKGLVVFRRGDRFCHNLARGAVRVMQRIFIAILAMLWLIGPASTSVLAGGYDHGNATGACSFKPPTAAVGQPYTVSATGLPTNTEVDLFVLNYETATREYQNLAVNPDGTWSGTFIQTTDGKFKFEFVSASTNATRLASKDAVCTIAISPPP